MKNYFDVVAGMKSKIQEYVEQGKRDFAIYPFGIGGLIAKDVLEKYFNIKPLRIIDNNLCKYNPDVCSLEETFVHGGETLSRFC